MMIIDEKKLIKLKIPLPCPDCDGRMYAAAYLIQSYILEESSLQVCKQCGFSQSVQEFKDKLLIE